MWPPSKRTLKRLKDFDVEAVDTVNVPANEQPFLILKNTEGGDSEMKERTLDKDQSTVTVKEEEKKEHEETTEKDSPLEILQSLMGELVESFDADDPDMKAAKKLAGRVTGRLGKLTFAKSEEEEKKEEMTEKVETKTEAEGDAVAAAVEKALKPLTDSIAELTGRVAEMEKKRGTKKSLDGQDGDGDELEERLAKANYPGVTRQFIQAGFAR